MREFWKDFYPHRWATFWAAAGALAIVALQWWVVQNTVIGFTIGVVAGALVVVFSPGWQRRDQRDRIVEDLTGAAERPDIFSGPEHDPDDYRPGLGEVVGGRPRRRGRELL